MSKIMHVFEFLQAAAPKLTGTCAVVGGDRFLKRLVFQRIRTELADDDSTMSLEGDKAEWSDVVDELSTMSLFGGGPKHVIVNEADSFVSSFRPKLEKFVAQEIPGCLILDVQSLPSNTKLHGEVKKHGNIIECKLPKSGRGVNLGKVKEWLISWAETSHGLKLGGGAAEELLHLSSVELGIAEQNLSKLALFVQPGETVSLKQVQQIVGGWRAKTNWDLFDAILDGNAAEALLQLERLLQAGEAPMAIMGGLIWSLRRFANAAHLVLEAERRGTRIALHLALKEAGFPTYNPTALQRAEKQLRQLGRHRAAALYQELLRADLASKSTHSSPTQMRWLLEQLILSLSKNAAA